MRRLTAGLALGLALTLAACGEDTPQTAATGTPTTAAVAATATASAAAVTATPTTTVSGAAATSTATPGATAPAAETAAPGAPPAKTAEPTTTPNPKSGKASVPMTCLKRQKLKNLQDSGSGLWSGNDAKSGSLIAVDGPYKSEKEAQESMETLLDISDAQVGGRWYVVSTSKGTNGGPAVFAVADCLDSRDSQEF